MDITRREKKNKMESGMMKMKRTWLLLILMSMNSLFVYAQKALVREGNKFYEEKKYKEATEAYKSALIQHPDYMPGLFNLSNALYQQKNFEASRKVMANTAKHSSDKQVKANANYNIGNTYMKEQKWDDAINAYKQTLRNNPQDEAAKYNLSYAQAMKKQQDNKDKNKDKKENKDNKDNKDKNDKDKDKNKEDNQPKDENDKQEEQKQDPNKDKDEQQQKPQPQPSKLSEQEADQLLNALSRDENKLHDKKDKIKGVPVKVEKDW